LQKWNPEFKSQSHQKNIIIAMLVHVK
jgi:hypothetical protein